MPPELIVQGRRLAGHPPESIADLPENRQMIERGGVPLPLDSLAVSQPSKDFHERGAVRSRATLVLPVGLDPLDQRIQRPAALRLVAGGEFFVILAQALGEGLDNHVDGVRGGKVGSSADHASRAGRRPPRRQRDREPCRRSSGNVPSHELSNP